MQCLIRSCVISVRAVLSRAVTRWRGYRRMLAQPSRMNGARIAFGNRRGER
jgi:hypothetical protein